MTYQLQVNVVANPASVPINCGMFNVDVTRPCRFRWLKCVAATEECVGTCFSYTIESTVDVTDANTRSQSKLLSVVPCITRLSCPRSTDFAYINPGQNVSIITITSGNLQKAVPNFFLFTLCVEFKPAQSRLVTPVVNLGLESSLSDLAL